MDRLGDDSRFALDGSGKADFSVVYNQPDPREYYLTLGLYNYLIPDAAKKVYGGIYAAYRRLRRTQRLKVIDVGCSFGVNAAVQRFALSLSELQARYAAKMAEGVGGEALLARDAAFYRGLEPIDDLSFVGVDVAESAVRYAVAARLLESGIVQNLEEDPLDDRCQFAVVGADVIISTGAVGYVGARSFTALLDGSGSRPWVAAFVLRQFSYAPIAAALEERGYQTEKMTTALFPQRRFVGEAEQNAALERLGKNGLQATPLEREGWFAAEFFLSRPREEAQAEPLEALVPVSQLTTTLLG